MTSTLRPRALLASLLAAAGLLSAASAAGAATIPVQTNLDVSGAVCTLRDAISAANANAPVGACPAGAGAGDVIDLGGRTGSIDLASPLPHVAAPVDIQGPGSSVLTISGGGNVAVLTIDAFAGNASLSGLRIADGDCTFGCGIHNDGTALLTDVTVEGNAAEVIGGTNAFPQGGGISNSGTMTLTRSTVSANTANAGGASGQNAPAGGGIYNGGTGTLTLDRSSVEGNSSTAGGAAGGSATTNASGGGISNFGTLNLTRSTISGNTVSAIGTDNNGAHGGGIANANAPSVVVTIDRSTIAGNTVSAAGPVTNQATAGGFNVFGTTFVVRSSTIAGNSAATGANAVLGAPATIKNTIVANPLGGGSNCAGVASSQGFNLTDGTGCGFTQPTDRLSTNPQLAPSGLADNGGPTKTIAPLPSSPAVDKGLRSAGEAVDQRGVTRPFNVATVANAPGGDGSDIGAVELPLSPDTTITSGPASGSVSADATPSFAFFADETGSTFECKVDSGPFVACGPAFATGLLGDGQHTFAVRAVNAAGKADATPATRTFAVDTTAPQTTITRAKVSRSKHSAKIKFTASEPGSTFECRLDKKPFKPCGSPVRYAKLKAGKHRFQVRATDKPGNVDATPAKARLKLKR